MLEHGHAQRGGTDVFTVDVDGGWLLGFDAQRRESMIVNLGVEHMTSLFFEHTKGLEHISASHFLQNADVHQSIIGARPWSQRKQGAPSLRVLNEEEGKIVGNEALIQSQFCRAAAIGHDRHQYTNVIANRAHPTHFFGLDG